MGLVSSSPLQRLVLIKICPWGYPTVFHLPDTHHSSNVLLVHGHPAREDRESPKYIGVVGFQHSSTEVEQCCCHLADGILKNGDYTLSFPRREHAGKGKTRGPHNKQAPGCNSECSRGTKRGKLSMSDGKEGISPEVCCVHLPK